MHEEDNVRSVLVNLFMRALQLFKKGMGGAQNGLGPKKNLETIGFSDPGGSEPP